MTSAKKATAKKILVIDDEPAMREWLSIFLKKEGFRVALAENFADALQALEREIYACAICDVRLPDGSGIDILRHGRQVSPETIFIMITAYSATEDAVEAMKLGASDYVIKPFDLDEFRLRLDAALERKTLLSENIYLRKELAKESSLEAIVGTSAPLREIMNLIRRVAPTDSSILIQGESGTGKELLARAIHALSPRSAHRFVSINCGGLPETLLESELFGHVKGSFTGAIENKQGLFEVAHNGTVLLDEISEMSPSMQVKLLRAIQENKFRHIGGTEEIEVDMRIISATNKNIRALVEEGGFREDLYYRINVISVYVPPLRERKEDIRPLATHFLKKYTAKRNKHIKDISNEAMERLERYEWRGNIRELENAVERAVALETSEIILPESLPDNVLGIGARLPDIDSMHFPEDFQLEEHLNETARRYVLSALKKSGGEKSGAAKLLGMNYRAFRYFAKKLGIE